MEENSNIDDWFCSHDCFFFTLVDNRRKLFWYMGLGFYYLLDNFDDFSMDY